MVYNTSDGPAHVFLRFKAVLCQNHTGAVGLFLVSVQISLNGHINHSATDKSLQPLVLKHFQFKLLVVVTSPDTKCAVRKFSVDR